MEEAVIVTAPTLLVFAKYLASGIGSVAAHRLAPWMARQRAEAERIAARGEADALLIRATGQSGSLRLIADAQEEVRSQLAASDLSTGGAMAISGGEIQQRIAFQEEKRHRNITAIANQALVALANADVSDHEPDHDWAARFFNEAQDVSSEEMQTLWAKVLAGQVERPGSTSIRTLGVLRDLDRSAAVTFRKLCSASVSLKSDGEHFLDARVPSLGGRPGDNALEDYGLSFDSLNVLNEHGLIISDYDSWFDYRICIGIVETPEPPQILRIPFCFENRFWIFEPIRERRRDQEFRLSGVALTRSGRELSRVVELEPVPKYRQAVIDFFQKQELRMIEVGSFQPHVVPG